LLNMSEELKGPMMGDLVFTRSATLTSWLIRKITGSKFSHVAVYFGKGLILESDWNGVIMSRLTKYADHEILSLDHTSISRPGFINSIFEHIGDSYDYPFLIAGLLHFTFGIGTKWIKKLDVADRWRCDEMVARCALANGETFEGVDLYEISPGFLHDYFSKKKLEKKNV
jgi:hypothetical protein